MTLMRSPFGFEMMFPTEVFDEVCRSFDVDRWTTKMAQGFPKYDQYLEAGNKVIEVALAGYSRDQLSVEVDDNTITLAANKAEETGKQEARVIARRSFVKSFTDPTKTWDLEAAEVSFTDGLLKVVIPPRKAIQPSKRVIEIK
jgi:HSP20 family molecular chaperone IbpA